MPTGLLEHSCAERTRLRFPDRRGDRAFFESICNEIISFPGVQNVEGRPVTGSIIISHDETTEQLIDSARTRGVFIVESDNSPDPSVEARAWRDWAEGALKEAGAPVVSLGTVAAALFIAMALRQLARGNVMPPAATALWYGLILLLRSNTNAAARDWNSSYGE